MNQPYTVGVDRREGCFYAARVTWSAGRPEVHALNKLDREQICKHHDPNCHKLVLSVPDPEVLVKRLRLTHRDAPEIRERWRFELAQSMLDPQDEFCFDLLAADNDHSPLGLIYRRGRLDSLRAECGAERGPAAVEYLVRAAALGHGYLSFCRRIPGELIALADFADNLASVCFVLQKQVVELAHLRVDERDLSSEEDLVRTAVELRTVVNFKLAASADCGISQPLAALVLNGDRIDDRAREVFSDQFPVGVSAPEIHRGLLGDQVDLKGVAAASYLVALGLTVN